MRADAARNRARILGAAKDLVTTAGADAGMDEIAARAGVAVGTLYRHFPTKAELVGAVMREAADAIAGELRAAVARVDGGGDAYAELAALFRRLAVDWAADRALRTVATDLGAYANDGLERTATEALGRLVDAAVTAGALRGDVTVGDVALLMATAPGDGVAVEGRARWAELVVRGLAGARLR